MYKRFVVMFYGIQIAMQAIFTLVFPVLMLTLISWLLNTKVGVGQWIYVPAVVLGFLSGGYSMIRFVLCANRQMTAMDTAQTAPKEGPTAPNKEETRHE